MPRTKSRRTRKHSVQSPRKSTDGSTLCKTTPAEQKNILTELFSTPKPCQPTLILTMGAPGSGKSSTLAKSISDLYMSEEQFVILDPDDIMAEIEHYRTLLDRKNKRAAEICHSIASLIHQQATQQAPGYRYHVVVDGTCKNVDKCRQILELYNDAGYRTILVFTFLNQKDLLTRVQRRYELTGRFVPDAVVNSAYEKIVKNFAPLNQASDITFVYDTSGKSPVKVYEKRLDGVVIKYRGVQKVSRYVKGL